MTTRDQLLNLLTSGASDWDTDLNSNFALLERGFHITARAGAAVNTGDVLWMNSGEFFFPFNPNSYDIFPHAMAPRAASSGDTLQAVAWGIVRSLAIHSPAVPGQPFFVSAQTPGVVVGSYDGADRICGFGVGAPGVLFQPTRGIRQQVSQTTSLAIAAVTGSTHLFVASVGRYGLNRQTSMLSNSADKVTVKFFADSGRTVLLYQTNSVTTVGSYVDRGLWPYDSSTDGVLYGSLKIESSAGVGSNTISVRGIWDRMK